MGIAVLLQAMRTGFLFVGARAQRCILGSTGISLRWAIQVSCLKGVRWVVSSSAC